MFRKKKGQWFGKRNEETVERTIRELFDKVERSSDFTTIVPSEKNSSLVISYYQSLIDQKLLQDSVLPLLKEKAAVITDLSDIKDIIPIGGSKRASEPADVEQAFLNGDAVVYFKDDMKEFVLLNISDSRLGQRETNDTQNEFSVIGPKIGFIEDLSTNLHLIREHLNSTDLIFEEMTVGTRSKTKVVLTYMEGVTNPAFVETAKQRLQDLDIDLVLDNTQLEQLISDNSITPFPTFITTERVDRTIWALIEGQLVIIIDKSSYAVIGPATLMEFFSNPEDFYLPPLIASFFKLIRVFGMLFSIFATSFYVAILTFHYEVIPKDLLGPIIFSRANVPFPPVMEVLFLEITIDLLREAGARLPSKIGQTLGIVGAIVIGQATVEAALTSTILLIVVALAALSSFTTPIYKMSNAIRLLRYPFIVLAAIWGGLGIFVGILMLIGHLARIKSLGVPYMLPIYPYRKGGLASNFLRPSFTKFKERPWYLRPLSKRRFSPSSNKDPKDGLNHE